MYEGSGAGAVDAGGAADAAQLGRVEEDVEGVVGGGALASSIPAGACFEASEAGSHCSSVCGRVEDGRLGTGLGGRGLLAECGLSVKDCGIGGMRI